jgi:hypothetical protein
MMLREILVMIRVPFVYLRVGKVWAKERRDARAKEHGDALDPPRAKKNVEMRGLRPAQFSS